VINIDGISIFTAQFYPERVPWDTEPEFRKMTWSFRVKNKFDELVILNSWIMNFKEDK
jgi:hypothetical protein